jgi:hypothetical protein
VVHGQDQQRIRSVDLSPRHLSPRQGRPTHPRVSHPRVSHVAFTWEVDGEVDGTWEVDGAWEVDGEQTYLLVFARTLANTSIEGRKDCPSVFYGR